MLARDTLRGPRILPLPGSSTPAYLSYFPDFRGALHDADPTLDVYSSAGECTPPYDSMDDISTSPAPRCATPPHASPSASS